MIFQCRQCDRWYKNPQWVEAIPESPQLLALLLKKIRGLGKVKLVDASFIWTEPHSRRIKVKLVIQKEVMNNAIVEKSFPIEFMIQVKMYLFFSFFLIFFCCEFASERKNNAIFFFVD